jgi:hypothetical protein
MVSEQNDGDCCDCHLLQGLAVVVVSVEKCAPLTDSRVLAQGWSPLPCRTEAVIASSL